MVQIFVQKDQVAPPFIRVTGPDVHHLGQVLRMKPGDTLQISDGSGTDFFGEIQTISREEIRVHILYDQPSVHELPGQIVLFQGLPKGDKMEWIIQKGVELGVHAVVPVAMSRSVVRLDAKKAKGKVERWQAIAEGAAKQSKRGIVPQILPVMSVEEALVHSRSLEQKLLPYEGAKGMQETREILSAIVPGQSIGIWIGPEGGIAPEEVALAEDAGFHRITLGKRILRTETAGLCLLSVLMFMLEQEA